MYCLRRYAPLSYIHALIYVYMHLFIMGVCPLVTGTDSDEDGLITRDKLLAFILEDFPNRYPILECWLASLLPRGRTRSYAVM